MAIASVLVNLRLGQENPGLLAVAADIASRYKARAAGIAVAQPIYISASDAYLISDLSAEDREMRLRQLAKAEQSFRDALQGRASSLAWHGEVILGNLAQAVGAEARGHDLILAGTETGHSFADPVAPVHLGDLILQAGRPVLVVPPATRSLALKHALVAWKDGAPARRAAADSLPLLKAAGRVTVVEVAPRDQQSDAMGRVASVVDWLGRHGIKADSQVMDASGDDSTRLERLAHDLDADLVVAGAYAHHRMQEWIFGGVTRSLLGQTDRCVLVSH